MSKEVKEIKITIGKTIIFATKGLNPIEVYGMLKIYEKKLSIEILKEMSDEDNKPNK